MVLDDSGTQGVAPIVALVCSAGASSRSVGPARAGRRRSPASVIVLQHQAPDHAGILAHILGRHSGLPLAEATDRSLLRPGEVAVVPSGRHALVTRGGRPLLIAPAPRCDNRPSVDLLLSTLALAVGVA
jgi:chemotaxis response regulator CheB